MNVHPISFAIPTYSKIIFFLIILTGKMNSEKCSQEKWPDDHQDEDDDADALSLSDLPLMQYESCEEKEVQPLPLPPQQDFHFCCFPSKQSEMRPADEIFFQGQIKCLNSQYPRSQSISSHHSSTSTGTSSSSAAPAPRNLFHSHPSPSPRIPSNDRQLILRNNFVKKSWSWSFFRLGLIAAPPEIAFRDLKTRCCSKNSSGGSEKKCRVKTWDLAGGCKKCSVADAYMKRSASDGERRRRGDEENSAAAMNINKPVNSRTLEWLKQLSIHGAPVDER